MNDSGAQEFDLIIIGAGINGAGIARDAAMRGLRVLLLDKGDIGSGTSSWSTRLIHGGLRYLEYGEIGLVRESLREREHLLQMAPHLVKPLPLLIPIYRGAKYGPFMVRLGMIAYDILSFDRSLDRHHMLGVDEMLQRAPGINSDSLRGAALYYDGQVEYAERLVLENVLAAREHGAVVHTGVEVKGFEVERGRVTGVSATSGSGTAVIFRGRFVLNVAGPWVDQVLKSTARPVSRLIGGTRGSHIVVDPFRGAPRDGVYSEAREDGRPFFILPWNDRFLVGTTDIRFEGDLDDLTAGDEEIDYLLRETNRVILSANLGIDSILYSYTGIRPLPYALEGDAAAITRRHMLYDHAADGLHGLVSVIGGKLTTYRSLAEKTVDLVCDKLALRTMPCSTRKTPLPGNAVDFLARASQFRESHRSLSPRTIDHLLRVYGTRANDVVALSRTCQDPTLLDVIDPATGAIGAEIVFSVQSEMARTMADILLRRTMIGLGPTMGLDVAEAAGNIARRHLGWDNQRLQHELEQYRNHIRRFRPRVLRP